MFRYGVEPGVSTYFFNAAKTESSSGASRRRSLERPALPVLNKHKHLWKMELVKGAVRAIKNLQGEIYSVAKY